LNVWVGVVARVAPILISWSVVTS